jgi:hypothetical protein
MPRNDRLRDYLRRLSAALDKHGEPNAELAAVLSAAEGELDAFLTSNELWGGAGSIADQAGGPNRTAASREIEAILIELGNEQVRRGLINPRTASWVKAFTEWRQRGI